MRRYIPELLEAASRLRLSGASMSEVAALLGATEASAACTMSRLGIKMPRAVKSSNASRRVLAEHVGLADRCSQQAIAQEGIFLGPYVDTRTLAGWRCKEGHEWSATPNAIQQGGWCGACHAATQVGKMIQACKDRAAEEGGKWLSDTYVNSYEPLEWECREGHRWAAAAADIVNKKGWCGICAIDKTKHTLEVCRAYAQSRGGEVVSDRYVNSYTNLRWRCKESHEWDSTPHNITYFDRWCARCTPKSMAEDDLATWVEGLLGTPAERGARKVLPPYEVDVWVPEKRIGIEYHGLYWHGEKCNPERKLLTARKHALAQAAGIRLVTVLEDEWLTKREAVENYLRAILGRAPRIGARVCHIVPNHPGAKDFQKRWHLQGSAGGESYSLVEGTTIRAVAVFARPNASRARQDDGTTWELARYAVGPTGVTGGMSKVLAAFRAAHPEAKVLLSYSDNRWSNGGMYRACGFTKVRENRSSYWYFRKSTQGPRYHRYTLRKSVLVARGGDLVQTEWALAQEQGWDRIWDAGTTLWSLGL